MAHSFLWKAFAAGALAQLVAARLPDGRLHGNMLRHASVPIVSTGIPDGTPVTSRNGTTLPPYNTTYFFDQLIDHNNPSAGTFQQRYWTTMEWYETGGPIILMTPGEANAAPYTGYLTNRTINGQIAQQQNGTTIVLEHRFFGLSNPKPDLSVDSLRLLNLQQATADLAYFAQNVVLPQPGGDQLKPNQAPWILVGGSYSGALTSWTMVSHPGVFFAGYASSGVVEAIVEFWRYFEPIRENMAANCSADIQAVIAHVDKVFTSGNTTAISALKDNWGLGSIQHLDDVAGALRNNLWDWQSLSPDSGGGTFFTFCDALEVKNGVNAPAAGWGLDHALTAWGNFWNTTYYAQICGTSDPVTCLGTYDPTQTYWTNTEIDNASRSWFWFVCNEVGFFQGGPPQGHPALVTSLVPAPYDERQCTYMFPEAFSSPPTPNVDRTNAVYHGWTVKENRMFVANGKRDPWKDATLSAEQHVVASTPQQPIFVGDGFHCSDLITANGAVDPTVKAVQNASLKAMAKWLLDFKPATKHYKKRDEVLPGAKPINAWFRQPIVI